MEGDLSSSSICMNVQEELLKSAKAKMGEVRDENERLKKLLAELVKEYQSLEKQISSMARSKHSPETLNSTNNHNNEDEQETKLISLSLGSWNSNKRYADEVVTKKQSSGHSSDKRRKVDNTGLELGLDCKFQQFPSESMKNTTMDNANRINKDESGTETWPPSRDLKAKDSPASKEGDEENLHQPQVKKTRVCIRSRCDSPTIHDGCQWRKYGQKIAKGNPCPRAYYRCTVSSNCPVRKQVQRYPQDMSILITTYEGTHNHPLPLSATAMASATSAAAAMLKTGSLTSQSLLNTSNSTTTSSYGLQTSNLITTFNNHPSMISAASHNSHPTVTVDLTASNPEFSPFNWSFSSSPSSSTSSRNSSSFLNFSSSRSSCLSSFDFNNNTRIHNNEYLNYGTLFPYGNSNDFSKNFYQDLHSHQQTLNETIAAAATKVIASNPNFQSVLEAAISSYVGNKAHNDQKNMQGRGSLMLFPSALSLATPPKRSPPSAADTRE